ncbi:hypothetical protein DYBT9623_00696 [Dyadobacter sp. CECT 9623]|uniref:Uncharacterized protein n=2 Tax=Dyadobacter linearis TaxID=2823330 RepID=A0ABM8UKN1_9BACT|nr:hypothetical protein DYBT9623_00696 [Dyadobacter sp. CECT 9623]
MLGSFIFLVFMFTTFKPKIRIIGKIAKGPLERNGKATVPEGGVDEWYWFKVVNMNSFFKVHDLKFSLFIMEPHYSGGKNVMFDSIELKKSDMPFLKSLSTLLGKNENDEFACRIRTSVDLEELMGRDKSIRLQVVAKHQLSGLTSYFTKDFNIDDIEEGNFVSGFWGFIKSKGNNRRDRRL